LFVLFDNIHYMVVTSPYGGVQSIVMSVTVLFVCLSADITRKFAWPNFTNFFVHVACGRGSVLLWWRCGILCTCGFMDDVMFSYRGSTGPE